MKRVEAHEVGKANLFARNEGKFDLKNMNISIP
jgi:hypothetical protein